MIALLFALLVVHALADYPLQGDFLSKAKNRAAPIPGVPWQQALAAHALIHAGGVAAVLLAWALLADMLVEFGAIILLLAAAEFVAHWLIDDAKCRGRISFNADQALHVACKAAWAVIAGSLLT